MAAKKAKLQRLWDELPKEIIVEYLVDDCGYEEIEKKYFRCKIMVAIEKGKPVFTVGYTSDTYHTPLPFFFSSENLEEALEMMTKYVEKHGTYIKAKE